ncbi:DegT/DnrJ/EryC1/StrS family aminotransferase [Parapedobacter tibetensis]|uniref:DegT/DnrJ/EryC1/StrS family aminotransferase n=1 Tax=Parapedobacter tibetensis TaxID=2972951 RepID=UPI00214DC8BD|nr:DegT/DnrJ/EryC1/StrS family aminotransferase [Parapedobacter tibetensis]
MTAKNYSRRDFIAKSSLLGAGIAVAPHVFSSTLAIGSKPAILGGRGIWADKQWPKWPRWVPETDEKKLLEVVRSGIWSRASVTAEFESEWARTLGAKRCLSVVNGTNALITALSQFHIGAGDEVIVPPYTFIASVTSVLLNGAMPVFVDIDPETFQIDPTKIEAKITSRTKAIMPVHILGLPVDMDRIMAIAKKYNLFVIEDACQAHLAEYNHKKVGTIGHAGCFSFQNSKNLPIGEGGAVVSNDDQFIDRCFSYHNLGIPYGTAVGTVSSGSVIMGTKVRFTEYQAAIGLAMLKRLDAETTTRNENAAYLSSLLQQIPGIVPYKLYDKVTRAAFHLYPFRFMKEAFGGLTRTSFIKAMRAEGVPCSSGYTLLTDKPYLNDAFQSAAFKAIYPPEMLDFDAYVAANRCPKNEQLCNEEAVWLTQNMLLGPRTDMDEIAGAISRIHKNAASIAKLHG